MAEKDKTPGIVAESDAEDFINRWSRRKAEAEAVAEARTGADVEPAVMDEDDEAAPESSEPAPCLTDEDMPPIETLDENADLSGFLSPGVSENLRRAALRKVFRSPKFNVCDGLDNYAGDYTNFPPLGDIITADMRHHMARALERLADEGEEEEEEEGVDTVAASEGGDAPAVVADTIDDSPAIEDDSTKIDPRDDAHNV